MKQNPKHTVSLQTIKAIDVFTNKSLCDLLLKSLRHYQKSYGLEIYGYLILPSKLTFVASQKENLLPSVLHSFAKYTTTRLIEELQNSRDERRSWMLSSFAAEGDFSSELPFKLWKDQIIIKDIPESEDIKIHLDRIYKEPVKLGWVSYPEAYCHSSADDIRIGELLPDVEHIKRVVVPF